MDTAAMLNGVEQRILDRRQFLKGFGVGGLVVGGVGVGATQISDDSAFQSLATLAGGAVAAPSPTTYYLPAVDGTDQGRIITASVETTDGERGLFVNLEGMEVRHDLQVALREAAAAAQELTGANPPENGILVSFTAETDGLLALRGKSWEAGLTVVLAAALTGVTPSQETLVTGVVADGGRLLPVGGIASKARAAREFGATRLLVPDGQEQQISGISVEGVETIGPVINTILNG